MRTLTTIVLTSIVTTLLLAALSAGAFVYVVDGYFVDLALERGSGGDPLAPRTVQDRGVCALLGRHGVDDRFDTLERVLVDVDILQRLAYAGDHRGQVFEVTHALDLLYLTEEVVEVKLVLGQLLLQAPRLGFVILLLCAFHERDHVAHAEDTVGHTFGMEHIERLHLFARADELDGLVDHRADRERRTTTRIAIELREHPA